MLIKILFEDETCIIVNKPNNVLVHNSYYARNIKDVTLLDLLQQQLQSVFFPVHRLDRKTSGVLLLAKKKKHVAVYQDLFTSTQIQKEYLGIVRGLVIAAKQISSPVKNPETKRYKDAETYCEPLFTKELDISVHPYNSSRYSLVKLKPSTGRMHQLRIHMNKISHPIVGDYKYGDRFHNRMFEQEFNCHKLFLHAHKLQFTHPITAQKIAITASLPEDWIVIFNKFDWKFDT